MESFLKFGALTIWPLFFMVSYMLIKSSSRKFKISSFSDLGSSKVNGTKFDILLIATGLFQIAFLSGYLSRYGLAIVLLMITSFFGILSGVVRQKGHLSAHKVICTIGFTLSAPGWAMLGLRVLPQNNILGTLLLAWGIAIIPLLLFAVFQKRPLLKYELVFFFGAFITNLILLALN